MFQTFHVYPYPFVIIPTDEYVDNGDNQMPSIQTFGPAKYKWKSKKNKTIHSVNAQLKVSNLTGTLLQKEHYEAVCYFVGVEPSIVMLSEGDNSDYVVCWDAVFNKKANPDGSSKASLDAYCKKIGLPFRCNDEDVASNNRRFRDFIQFCLPVRIGLVEGNH